MRKKGILLLLLLGLTNANLYLFAQHDERRKAEFEEFKEKRVAFITKAMDLTGDEAKAFWPLYNELQEKKFDLNQQQRKTILEFKKSEKEGKTHTESEYKDMVDLITQFKINDAKLDEEYITKFVKVISYEKVFRYQQSELQFARQMLNQRSNHTSENPKKK
jgi:hypothetical protein